MIEKESIKKLERLFALLDKCPSPFDDDKLMDCLIDGVIIGVGLYLFDNVLESDGGD